MTKKATDVPTYLANLSPERHQAFTTIRDMILKTVPEAEETMDYNMPTYQAAGDFLAALASQKHYISLYVNTDVMAAHKAELGKLNCGKSCIRFKKVDDLPPALIKTMLQETYQKNKAGA